jgi:hypothetical protein
VGGGRGAHAAGPELSWSLVVHTPDRRQCPARAREARVCRRRAALAWHDGRDPQPQRLPAAPGAQSQARKKVPQTDAIFDNIQVKDGAGNDPSVARGSIDCKATVNIGPYSRGGKTRGDNRAADHDMGCREKYPPFGILEEHWNGTQLHDAETMLQWAKSMTWKGLHPIVELSRTVYAKGVTLSKKAMREVEARLQRNPELPKWDILIRPACSVYRSP